MTEQTRNIQEAILAKNLSDREMALQKERAELALRKVEKHLKRLRTLHLHGSTKEEVDAHKNDPYFSSWFKDVEQGDIHTMHSILDHFEPLEIITNMGHNYRSRFSADTATITLDFRPADYIPKFTYTLEGYQLQKRFATEDEVINNVKSYLYSCILRMAKELILYFPLHQLIFEVNCEDINLQTNRFEVTDDQVKFFLLEDIGSSFNEIFEKRVLDN